MKNVSKAQVLDRLQFENPWWLTGEIEKDYEEMPRRLYFELFKTLAFEEEIRRALVLMGPRRVGKTVMLYHTVSELINKGYNPKKIIFITIENPIYNNMLLEQLFLLAKEAVNRDDQDGWFIIFDEIQYCKHWDIQLKSLVDSYRKSKFIVSGSAAAALKFASTESGAGRFTDFKLPPLTFHEYIDLKGLDHIITPITLQWRTQDMDFYTSTHLDELNRHFVDYINFGGYPEVIFSDKIQANPGRYIRQDIVDKVLLRDLPSLYGISDTRELNSLFTTIAYNTAEEFSLETLNKQSQIDKRLLAKYLEYLEAAFLIKKVQRVDQSGKRFKREVLFKLYLTNPSLRSALFSPMTATDEMFGNQVETAIFAQWMHRDWFTPWYARWTGGRGGEVDMISISEKNLRPIWALEVKWSNRYFNKPKDLKSLLKFCAENEIETPICTTLDKAGEKKVNGISIQYLPSAAYAYTVGKRTLDQKRNH